MVRGLVRVVLFVSLCLTQLCGQSVEYNSMVAAGAAYNRYASPQINGWLSYVKRITTSKPIFSYSTYDITSVKQTPFTVQTSLRTGVLYVVVEFGKVKVFEFGDVGMAVASVMSGTNVGAAYSGGGGFTYELGKGWHTVVVIRELKTSLSDRQTVVEGGFGWASK